MNGTSLFLCTSIVRVWAVLFFLLAAAPPVAAQLKVMQVDPESGEITEVDPVYSLAPMSSPQFRSDRYRASVQELQEIDTLIASLVETPSIPKSFMPSILGSDFPPVKGRRDLMASGWEFGGRGDSPPAVVRLVELGPKAIPALLAALDDSTPSLLVLKVDGRGWGMEVHQQPSMDFNPAIEREAMVLKTRSSLQQRPLPFQLHKQVTAPQQYTLTRGDLCKTILGVIVNRRYHVLYAGGKYEVVVSSAMHEPELAAAIRELWQSDDPAGALFASLMQDLHTRSENDWSVGQRQCSAAVRLLHYFRDESGGVIAARINALDVAKMEASDAEGQAEARRRQAANGVEIGSFLAACTTSSDPRVLQAIAGVIARTDQPWILQQCLTPETVAVNSDAALAALRRVIDAAPRDPPHLFGQEIIGLRALPEFFPEDSQAIFAEYVDPQRVATLRTAIHALSNQPSKPNWVADFLLPWLADQREVGLQYGPEYDQRSRRVCDEAARVLAEYLPEAKFELKGDHAALDAQIAGLRAAASGAPPLAVGPGEVPDEPVVPMREPLASLVLKGRYGTVYDISTPSALLIGRSTGSDCSSTLETVAFDWSSGRELWRAPMLQAGPSPNIVWPIRGSTMSVFDGRSGELMECTLIGGIELWRVSTAFLEDHEGDPAASLPMFHGIALTADKQWALAATRDGALHSIELATGQTEKLWSYPGKPRFEGFGLHMHVHPVQGRNQVFIDIFGEDTPPRLWDQDTRQMTELLRIPFIGWRNVYGDYAVNALNNQFTLWNLRTCSEVLLPRAEADAVELVCDTDQTTAFVARKTSIIDVVRLPDARLIATLTAPAAIAPQSSLLVSHDDAMLILRSTEHNQNDRSASVTTLVAFDVADLTR